MTALSGSQFKPPALPEVDDFVWLRKAVPGIPFHRFVFLQTANPSFSLSAYPLESGCFYADSNGAGIWLFFYNQITNQFEYVSKS